ncbi:uncharacterized protein si:ch211-227n13.3 isoform X2 [Esox lucius]|uniref:uncharacterized protein si:ch211-227n13.3 isoform X2 n=1 Tax=Esox lucius TaxID=8010 RepID=UPI0005777984|nr:uncharacterized protein si:ch211-227n13.3 isoform X2 [Esox lucius]
MILSKRLKYEHFETKSQYSTDQGSGDGTGGYIRVNLQCCVRWGSSMRPSRRGRSSSNKASNAGTPSDPAAQLGVGRSRRPAQCEDDSHFNISDKGPHDLIDLIDDYSGNGSVSECWSPLGDLPVSPAEAVIGGKLKAQPEKGRDSDAESCSSLDSIASGPSFMVQTPHLTPPTGLCLTCLRLYQEASIRDAPLDTLPDNDPTSLSCDQWVLKKRRPSRIKWNVKGLWIHLRRIRKREQTGGEREQVACSRPHIFLQRNLRRYERLAVIKGRKKIKRRRKKASVRGGHRRAGKHVTKWHSLQGSGLQGSGLQGSGLQGSGPHSDPDIEAENSDGASEAHEILTFQVFPSSLTMETRPHEEATPQTDEEPGKRRGSFRTLLAQLRSNCSRVVRETHT